MNYTPFTLTLHALSLPLFFRKIFANSYDINVKEFSLWLPIPIIFAAFFSLFCGKVNENGVYLI